MAYIRTPFGTAGDRTAIPNDVQPDGSVSQTEGFGIDYQLDPGTDPDALNVPRDKFNEIIYDTQVAVQQYQQDGQPLFINPSDNGGVAFSYKIGAVVRYTAGWAGAGELVYYSLVAANTANPSDATKWGLVQYTAQYFTGFSMPWFFSALPDSSWVWLNGLTIGNAASNATGRANADTSALFIKFWNDYPTTLPIYTSAGVLSTRGISAAADYAANKALALPDLCGRSFSGADNMGGITAKGRITDAISGIAGTTIGATGGAQGVQLTGNQNGVHTHVASTASAGTHTHTASTASAGDHSHFAFSSTIVDTTLQVNNTQQASSRNNHTAPEEYENIIGGTGSAANTALTSTAGAHTHTVTVDSAGAHTHTVTVDNSGVGEYHQNMPPTFVGGGWIMKL